MTISNNISKNINFLIEESMEIYKKDIKAKLPEELEKIISLLPEAILEIFEIFKVESMKNKADISDIKITTLLNLILEYMFSLRYDLDRGNSASQKIFNDFNNQLALTLPTMPHVFSFQMSQLFHEAKLPISEELQSDVFNEETTLTHDTPDIHPKLPEILEQLKRDKIIKSEYDLCEMLQPAISFMPVTVQLSIIYELTLSKKTLESSVLFLLHPQKSIRVAIVNLFLASIEKVPFTSISLRRMIVIRNWLPEDEREVLDDLIKKLRLKGIAPAPFPAVKTDKISASAFDGAGVQAIIISGKHRSKRSMAGLLLKIDIGIRDPWVELKASKGQHESIIEQQASLEFRDVSKNYINKLVRHFIYTGINNEKVPDLNLLLLSETMGFSQWQAGPMDVENELAQLQEMAAQDLSNPEFIAESLNRTGYLHREKQYANTWFDQGEAVDKRVQKALALMNSGTSEEKAVIQEIVLPNIEKWKKQLILMCLWARENAKKQDFHWKDFLVLLTQLEKNKPLEELPFFCELGEYTILATRNRNLSKEFYQI